MINIKKNRILPQVVRRLFSPPYLPRRIVGLALFIIFTEGCLKLIGQPPEYWVDYSLAQVTPPFVQQIMAIHPLLYLGIIMLNVILIGLFLEGLSRMPALILWMIITLFYLDNILGWIDGALLHPLAFDESVQIVLSVVVTIAAAGILGWKLVRALFTTQDTDSQIVSKYLKPITIGSIGIWAFLLLFGFIQAMNKPVQGWHLITPEHLPTPRVGGEIAFDSKRGKALLFGGSGVWTGGEWVYDNETWEWDGLDWVERFPEVAPPGRGGLGLAYDVSKSVIILFGGNANGIFFNDTWEWDGEVWRKLAPANMPSAREGSEMIYDFQRGQIVLYGGHDEFGSYLNDAWAWDGQTWSPILFETVSPQASCFSMIYDPSFNRLVAFLSGYPGGTWFWQDNRWVQLETNDIEPWQRCNAGAAYDLANERAILFGGIYGDEILNETWIFDGLHWQKTDLLLSASARWGHAIFYDEIRQKVIVFGGFDGTNNLNDMWEFVLPVQD